MSSRTVSLLLAALALPGLASAGYEASSFKKDRRDNLYNVGSAIDSNPETCWMVDPEKRNEGEWIQLDVPSSTVDKLSMIIGWDQDEKTFSNYARVKKARVDIFDLAGGEAKLVKEHEVTFEDKQGWQVVRLPETKVGGEVHGGRVRITVLETYPGRDYPNLAVSEVRVHLKEFPAETIMVATTPDAAADGHHADLMTDNNPRTFWASEADPKQTMAFKAAGYGLASIGVQPGPKPYARPKTLKLTANDLSVTVELADKAELQWHLLPAIIGYTGSAWGEITVEVVDTYPGDAGKGVAIAEVKLNAATIEDF